MRQFIMLSIKRKYLDLIASGQKNVEFRKMIYLSGRDRIFFVCEKHVHGFFLVSQYRHKRAEMFFLNPPFEGANYGITEEELYKYTGGSKNVVTGILIKEYQAFANPVPIEKFGIARSPQNFCYAKKVPDLEPLVKQS